MTVPKDYEHPGAPTLLWRAARLMCPYCGARGVLESWFKLADRCSACGLRFERGEQDYFTGSMLFNLVVVETLFAVGVVSAIVAMWPTPAWRLIFFGGIGFMTVAPFAFFPFSKTLWLALDLVFRPRGTITRR